MSTAIPVFRPVAWISLVPQLTVMAFLMFIWYKSGIPYPYLWGSMSYLLLSFCLRSLLLQEHRAGMKLTKKERFMEAIQHFEKSYEFFTRHTWMDKYRYLALLSSSRLSYREMALINIAFCYGQAGDGIMAREYYEKTLQEFPDSGMAKTALRLIGSAAKYLILLPALMLTSLEGRAQTNDVANGPCIELVDIQLQVLK